MENTHQNNINDIIKEYGAGKVYVTITLEMIENDLNGKTPLDETKPIAVFLEAKYYKDANYQDLSGFEVIYKLRRDCNFKGSIIVLSFIQEEQIENINYKNKQLYPARILHTSNIEFYTIDGTIKNRDNIREEVANFLKYHYELEDLGLEDIKNYVSNYKYLLDEVLHDFKNRYSYQQITFKQNIELLKQNVEPFVKPEKVNTVNVALDLIKDTGQPNFDSTYNSIKGLLQGSLKTNEFSKEKDNETSSIKNREWEVLYIDDDEEACKQMKAFFSCKPFRLKCHTANNQKKINDFSNNINDNEKIYWVISDYRLKNKHKWFPLQGYDLLINSFEAPRLTRSICTTANNLINESARFNTDGKIQWYNKSLMLKNKDYFEWVVGSQINKIDRKYDNREMFIYPSTWYKELRKKDLAPLNMDCRFVDLYKKLQNLSTDFKKLNETIDKSVINILKQVKKENNISKRNKKLIGEFKKLEIEPMAKLKELSFDSGMHNRLMVRKLIIGHFYLFNEGWVSELKPNKSDVSKIRHLSGFYPSIWKTSKKAFIESELHSDDKTFLDKLDYI